MTRVPILATDRWQVISYGNGWAYWVLDKERGVSAWLQDHDATDFRDTWEWIETGNPTWSQDQVALTFWDMCDLGSIAIPDPGLQRIGCVGE